MIIEQLTVNNFRNLGAQTIDFSPGLNVLFGRNAQGKTNTLEAIYCSTIGRSPRTRKDSEMITFGQNKMSVRLKYSHATIKRNIEYLQQSGSKNISIDGNKLNKISDIIGNFGSVYFSPEELQLVQSGPSNRRRFMDIINCQLSKQYLAVLQHFQKLLEQRNALLKRTDIKIENQIGVWNEQLAKYGVMLHQARKRFCANLQDYASNIHQQLSNHQENLEIIYQSIDGEPNNLVKNYITNLEQAFEKDKVLGYTTYGVQNDDFLLKVNGCDLRKTGSQGQQRTATLALKLAELEILREEYGEYPVLLLDDVLSELDETRRQKLAEYIQNIQCLLTCTEFDLKLPCKKFKVENGHIEEQISEDYDTMPKYEE